VAMMFQIHPKIAPTASEVQIPAVTVRVPWVGLGGGAGGLWGPVDAERRSP
jgi:hypothetical protein